MRIEKFDEVFFELVRETRGHRANMAFCPSAQEGVNVSAVITEFCGI